MTINLPNNLNDAGCISFIKELNSSLNIPEDVYLNFKQISWVEPFGTLVSAEALKTFNQYRKEHNLNTYYLDHEWLQNKSSSAISYLKYFGFFKYCGANIGELPNKEYHTMTYLPIQVLRKEELENGVFVKDWRNPILKKCSEMSLLISDNDYITNYLEYGFRETIRNVFEHSGSTSCSVMAQYWKNSDEIEIAVADRGVGIHNTISDKYKTTTVFDSISLALEPGVSRMDIEKSSGNWGNSGFGLYLLSGIGKEYGHFSILSSGTYIKQYELEQKTLCDDNIFFKGTAIKIKVKRDSLDYFPNLLEKLIRDGESIYEKRTGKKIKASGMSRKSLNK